MTQLNRHGTPDLRCALTGPRPDRWITGTNPVHRRLRRRWLLAKNQARFWHQDWRLDWEPYRDLWLAGRRYLRMGTGAHSLNLIRTDGDGAWELANVRIISRGTAMRRPLTRRPDGTVRPRVCTRQGPRQQRSTLCR